MTATHAPASPHPPPATASAPQPVWFASSNRLVDAQPDSHYGWLPWGQDVFIVKALNLAKTNHGAATLLDYERKALAALNQLQAPVPALWDQAAPPLPSGWLATRFGGLSLQRLSRPGTPQQYAGLPLDEQWACWVHFLERAQGMAAEGIIPIDLWAGNLVVPFTQGLGGQLKLNGITSIDHAHTVAAGWNMRRPLWLSHKMPRIPPELRPLIKADREALMQHFRDKGLGLTASGLPQHTDPERVERTRDLWLDYNQPQTLQQKVDAGLVNAHHATQYAVAVALHQQCMAGLPAALQQKLQPVLNRMATPVPAARFATLQQAADALRRVLPNVPLVGAMHYPPVGPDNLRPPSQPTQTTQHKERLLRLPPTLRGQRDWPLVCLALGLGAAIGVIWLG